MSHSHTLRFEALLKVKSTLLLTLSSASKFEALLKVNSRQQHRHAMVCVCIHIKGCMYIHICAFSLWTLPVNGKSIVTSNTLVHKMRLE